LHLCKRNEETLQLEWGFIFGVDIKLECIFGHFKY